MTQAGDTASVPLRVSLGLSHPHAAAQSTHRVDTATLKNLSDWMSKDRGIPESFFILTLLDLKYISLSFSQLEI